MDQSFGRVAAVGALSMLILVGASIPGWAQAALATDPTDPDVAATVEHVLTSAHHPRLAWPEIPNMAPALKAAYDTEPDRLIWFNETEPSPTLTRALGALGAAGEYGLEPADYDAQWLTEEWALLNSGAEISGRNSPGPATKR